MMDPSQELHVYNPLDQRKDIGRRTGLPIYKKRNLKNAADQFDNYLSESDGEQSINVTKTAPLLSRENIESPEANENTTEKSHLQSDNGLNRPEMETENSAVIENANVQEIGATGVGAVNPFGWNARYGRRTGKDLLAGRRSKIMSKGMENFSDFLSDSSDTSCTLNPTPIRPISRTVCESPTSTSAKESEADSSPARASLRKMKGKKEKFEVEPTEMCTEDPVPEATETIRQENYSSLKSTEVSRTVAHVQKELNDVNENFRHSFAQHQNTTIISFVENESFQIIDAEAETENVEKTEKENSRQYLVNEKEKRRTNYQDKRRSSKRNTGNGNESKRISQPPTVFSDIESEKEYLISGAGLDHDPGEEITAKGKKNDNRSFVSQKQFLQTSLEKAIATSQSHIEGQTVRETSIILGGNKNLKEKEAASGVSHLGDCSGAQHNVPKSPVLACTSAKSLEEHSETSDEKTADVRKSSDDGTSSGTEEPKGSKMVDGPSSSSASHLTRTKLSANTLDFGGDGAGSVSKADTGHQSDFYGIKKRLSYSIAVLDSDKKSEGKRKGKSEGKSKGKKSSHSFLESHDTASQNFYNSSSVSAPFISLTSRRVSQLTSQTLTEKLNSVNLNTSSASSADFNIVEEEVIVARKSPFSEEKDQTSRKRKSPVLKDKGEQVSRSHMRTKKIDPASPVDIEAPEKIEASQCKRPKKGKNQNKNSDQIGKENYKNIENSVENEEFHSSSMIQPGKARKENYKNIENLVENEDFHSSTKIQPGKASKKRQKRKKGETDNLENDKLYADSERRKDKIRKSDVPDLKKNIISKTELASGGKKSKASTKIPVAKKIAQGKTHPAGKSDESDISKESITMSPREGRKRKVTGPVQYPYVKAETKATRKQNSRQQRLPDKKSKSQKIKATRKERMALRQEQARFSKTSPKQTRLRKKKSEKKEKDTEVENIQELDGPLSPLNHPELEGPMSPLSHPKLNSPVSPLNQPELVGSRSPLSHPNLNSPVSPLNHPELEAPVSSFAPLALERSSEKLTEVSKTNMSELKRETKGRKSTKKQKTVDSRKKSKTQSSPVVSEVIADSNTNFELNQDELCVEPEMDEIGHCMEYSVPLNGPSHEKKTPLKKSSLSGKRNSVKSTQSKGKQNGTLDLGDDFSPLRSLLPNITPQSGVSFRLPRHSAFHSVQKSDAGSKPETPNSKALQTDLNPIPLSSCLRGASTRGPQKRGRRVRISNIIDNHLLSPPLVESADHTTDVGAQSLLSMSSSPVHYAETTTSNITQEKSKTSKVPIPDLSYKIVPPEQNPVPGLRRSSRTRVQRLNSYKGEGIKYRRDSTGFGLLVEGIQPSLIEAKQKVKEEERRKKHRQRKLKAMIVPAKPPKKRLSTHWTVDQDVIISSEIPVINPDNGEEVVVDLIARMDEVTWVGPTLDPVMDTDPVAICLQLQQKHFQTGELHMRPFAEKETQLVEETLIFKMIHGKVCVTINNVSTIVETGDDFGIPRGSWYSIKNLRRDIAKIHFVNLNIEDDNSSRNSEIGQGFPESFKQTTPSVM